MKSLLSVALIILSAFEPNTTATVLASRCPLYSAPNFTSAIVQYEDADFYLSQNDQVKVIQTDGDFVLVKANEETQGYVYRYYLTQNSSQTTYPVFNATMRENSPIYDLEKTPVDIAEKGKRVFIFNGFDNVDGGFTEIQIVLENGELYSGLVKSSSLKPDGINRNAIIAIPIILAGITVVLSIVFLGRKKKKKKMAV